MKLRIHPLFLAVGVLSALFGGLPEFVIYTLTALLHECGHIFCAQSMGYSCSRVTLMPYGASAACSIEGISVRDELRLALVGPLVNACICVFLAGLWWFVPDTYAFTDTVMQANAVMLAINLLPAYPLDGGRAARCLLCKIMPERAADITLRVCTVIFSITLAVLSFVLGIGLNGAAFCALLLFSAFSRPVPACKIKFTAPENLRRGLQIKYLLVSEDTTYRRAIKLLDERHYCVFCTLSGKKLTQDELYNGFMQCSVYDKIFAPEQSAESKEPCKMYADTSE